MRVSVTEERDKRETEIEREKAKEKKDRTIESSSLMNNSFCVSADVSIRNTQNTKDIV